MVLILIEFGLLLDMIYTGTSRLIPIILIPIILIMLSMIMIGNTKIVLLSRNILRTGKWE